MAVDELRIHVHGREVARLIEHDNGEGGYDIRYLPEAGPEAFIGLTLHDVEAGRYDGYQEVPPTLLQNMPEGALLEMVRAVFGKTMNLASDFGLLKVIGPYQHGRVTIGGVDEEATTGLDVATILEARGTEALFHLWFRELGLGSATVSGVQPKLTAVVDNRATATFRGIIVKFRPFQGGVGGMDYPGLAINEYYSLRAAAHAGLEVPTATLSDDGEILVVERFDLPWDAPALGFEDACSLTDLAPKYRYHGDYAEMYELLTTWLPSDLRAAAKAQLFRSLVLSCLIGNGDAHRKNHALLYASLDDIRLAPFYDLVSTVFYLPQDKMALALDATRASKDWPEKHDLQRFGESDLGLARSQVMQAFEQVVEAVGTAATELEAYLADGPPAGRVLENGIDGRRSLAELWRHRIDRLMR